MTNSDYKVLVLGSGLIGSEVTNVCNNLGYTHTSVAIHDALKILKIPIIELHISNIYNREDFRHKSLISKVAKGIICGFGSEGYIMALKAMKNLYKNEN